MKWEYMEEVVIADKETPLLDFLNKRGDEGWELCMTGSSGTRTAGAKRLYFKRPKAETVEISGQRMEALRKTEKARKAEDTKPLIVEMAILNLGGAVSEFGQKTAMVQVQCPDIDFKKEYEYKYQWTASMAQRGPSAAVNMENARVHVESLLRKDLALLDHNPSSLKWV